MNKFSLFLFGFLVCLMLFPDIVMASTKSLPSGWDQTAHASLLTKVTDIKNFMFSTPLWIAAVFYFCWAIYHTFSAGSIMPLLSAIGIIILASIVPLFLDMFNPVSASGMVLPG